MMTTQTYTFSPTLRAELAKLDDAGILRLLSEIIQPSHRGPISFADEEMYDKLIDVDSAYCAAYYDLVEIAERGEDYDPRAEHGLSAAQLGIVAGRAGA
mgnify:CR=1 FL=1